MSKSFKEQTEAPPVEFRTPSPPLRFCEAISPDFSEYLRRTPPAPEYEQITPERINGFEQELDGLAGVSEECRRYGNSDLEDSRLPRQFYKTHNQSTTIQSSAHTRDWSKSELDHDDRAREEAELLLNFTREAHLAIPKVPPAIPTSNPRSASFNSYIQTRPSVSDLQSSLHMREQKYGRPTTQNGTRSIWKEEVLYPPESPRRASYYDQVLDNPRESPPPELQNKIEIASTMGVAPATRFDSVEMKEEKVEDTTKAIDPTTLPPIHTSGETRTAESSISMALETPALMMNPALQKKNQDIPSICASCNFARNTNDNEADSDSTSWISCDGCRSWFHFACAGFKSEREVRAVDKFRCKNCKPVFGATTYVRKSSRAHTSIDYAGLNEGVIKTSDADPEHHYVKDFKNGKKFTPETFARMRPELVTAKFFELGDGMKEPIVIPAALNPRPNPIPTADLPEDAEDFETEVKKYELLHDRSNLEIWTAETFEYETVQDQGQDALDMVIPRDLTVRRVAELYGVDEKLEVIDVKSQNGEDKPWTLQRWADYYESSGEKVVRNVISLEVSQSRLGRLIRRPKIVRDLDLQDSVWPSELQAKGEYPKVQFYCLMSVADCYTDFHIDFGGSSVYYHILRGKKTFFFIPPTEKHLKQYEEWCNSPAQNWTFLGDQTNQCYRVDLFEGDTMLIPAGWIHAVWTPADSLVIGGNFLTRLHYPIQIRVAQIEKATNVARKFRYPHFQKLLWYAAVRYMDEDPMPESMVDILHNGQIFERSAFDSEDYDAWGEYSPDLEENYQARYYPRAELEGLPELCRYLLRTALIATGNLTEGISTEIRNAIKRSMPKGHNHGKPFEAIKKFALWCAWKRGNETIPYWAYPNYIPEDATAEGSEKNLSTRARKKLDHDAANQAFKIAPDRQSTRPRSQPQNDATACEISKQDVEETTNTSKRKLMETVDSDSTLIQSKVKRPRVSSSARSGSGRKTACEACRKSRRACKHGKISRQDSSSDTSLLADVKVVTPIKVTASEDLSTNYASMIDPPDDHHIKSESNGDRMILDTTFDDQSTTIQTEIFDSPQTKLSGRTKACKDCRKSKRRCVHDEQGNEDPRKVAEAIIPRPAAKKKRFMYAGSPDLMNYPMNETPLFPSYNEADTGQYDILMQEVNHEDQEEMNQQDTTADEFDISHLIDPALLAEGAQETLNIAIAQSAEEALNILNTNHFLEENLDPQLRNFQSTQMTASSLVSPPDSTNNDREDNITTTSTTTATIKNLTPPPTATDSSSSRHPSSSSSPSTPPPPPPSSSRLSKALTISTPKSNTSPQRNLSSNPGDTISNRDSTSPMINLLPLTTTTVATTTMTGSSKGSTTIITTKSRASSEIEADEASLKLIREMQAQDLGLRRRA